ncbi:MAG: ATP-binding protein [Actinomycetota bacterium]|nr:ATP-binding protein [Actinomycetota bacterium]
MALSTLAAALLGTALVVLIVAVMGQRDAARTAFRSQEALAAGSQLEKSLITIENGLRGFVLSGRSRSLAFARQALRGYPGERRALARLVSDDPGQQALAKRIGAAVDDYVHLWFFPVIRVARGNRNAARSQLLTGGGRTRLGSIRSDFARLFARERAIIRFREDRAEAGSARAIGFGIGGLGLVLAVTAGVALYLRRAVVHPVVTVAAATGRLAAGELSTRVPAHREDELGSLARGFNTMADSLQRSRDELEHSNLELQRSNAELEQFASVTSHDLQAPLTTISMYAELLERSHGGEGNGTLELVEGIRGATQQARALIRDLLEYSRAGRGTLSLEAVPLERVVRQATQALAGAIEEAGGHVSVGALPVVRADRANLCRVFQNLIGNAVKFAGERPPEVSVEAQRDGDQWRIAVRDNGIGMNPEHTGRIFEPFQRLHGEEEYAGTGIGLAVCERIITQHGGRIWVTSRPGEGSVFEFTLPAVDAPVAAPGAEARVEAEA